MNALELHRVAARRHLRMVDYLQRARLGADICHSRVMASTGLTSEAVSMMLSGSWTPTIEDVRGLAVVWGADADRAAALYLQWRAALAEAEEARP